MYWSILVNVKPDSKDNHVPIFDPNIISHRWGDEARFRYHLLAGNYTSGLVKIVVYDVQPLWYKNNGREEDERCADDVIADLKDHLYYCGHDVISSQLDRGVP